MKLIVGLGNPGEKYENTRHNVGFFVINKLSDGDNVGEINGDIALVEWGEDRHVSARTISLDARAAVLAKPQTFMNESGRAVKYLCQKHKLMPEEVLVVHDDLDIPLGSYKLQFGKGPKLHNGVKSVEDHLGTKDFWRLRVGVENRGQNGRSTGEDYVLGRFNKEELEVLTKLVNEKIIPELKRWMISSST